jgi:hypothetical protein
MSSNRLSRKSFVPLAGAAAAALLLLASGCGNGKPDRAAGTTTTTSSAAADRASIALRVSAQDAGPWSRRLSIRLGRGGVPVQFFICGVRATEPQAQPCVAQPGAKLPSGATLRLEQQPPGPGAKRPDTPGWGLVGTGEDAFIKVTLSDFVSADNKPGTITYRVTERDPAGHILATSNPAVVSWHR